MVYTLPPVPSAWQSVICTQNISPIAEALSHIRTPIYPPSHMVWNALSLCQPSQTKIVIMGQDPYHQPHQAMGLSFSVPHGVKIPPSLQNIYKELYNDMGISPAPHGDITHWAKQGVLLLNTVLTVEESSANAHATLGWHHITNHIIHHISTQYQHIVFILWGKQAQTLIHHIQNQDIHCILTANHPSPLSANRGGFFGCKHFSKANAYLLKHNKQPIDWHNV